jgi:hypothetical protein
MDDPLVLAALFLGVPWAIGAGIVWWRQPSRRARRLLARAPEKALVDVVEGQLVRVRGKVRAAGALVETPFGGRKCIGFRAVAEEKEMETWWKEVVRLQECAPFLLSADGVEASVEGPFFVGLDVDFRSGEHLLKEQLDTLAKHGVRAHADRGRRRSLRFHEAVLEDGDPVWVVGRVRIAVDPRGQSESLRGPPVLRVLEGTKRAPVVVADQESRGETS